MGGQLLRIGKDSLIHTPSKSKNTLPSPNPPPTNIVFSPPVFFPIINFRKKFVEQVLEALQKRFSIKLPKNKLYFH